VGRTLNYYLFALALLGCEAPPEQAPAPTVWVVPPASSVWPFPAPRAAIGRQQAPQLASDAGLWGSVGEPLRSPTPWQVPGDGPARAIIYGTVGGQHAIELVEIDSGKIVWRDTKSCTGPVVGVTADVAVCTDGSVVRAVGVDGKPKWRKDGGFVVMTDEHVVLTGDGDAVIIDADLGDETARVKLPAGITADSIVASCGDAGRELFASGQDGRLVRIAEASGGPKISWAVPTDRIVDIDACAGKSILVTDATSITALARDTGKQLGRINNVLGHWTARDSAEHVEVSTIGGVQRYARDLSGGEARETLPFGELLASRGELRLVRATRSTAVLLDGKGVRAYLPFAHAGAAIGDRALVASTWTGSPGEHAHRLLYPPRYAKTLRFDHEAARYIAVPAELRDLPDGIDLDVNGAVALATGDRVPSAVKVDGDTLYVQTPGAVWFGNLKTHEFKKADCDVFATPWVCATRVKDGISLWGATWSWKTSNIDALESAGQLALAWNADGIDLVDIKNGTHLDSLASDTGTRMPAALLDRDLAGTELLVSAERGHVVARLPRIEMMPIWSVEVRGVVTAITAAAAVSGTGTHDVFVTNGLLVVLEGGDAYRLDPETGEPTPIAGIGPEWRVDADVIAHSGEGGPIPPANWPPGAAQPKTAGKKGARPRGKAAARVPDDDPPPRLMTPLAPPPGLKPSYQLTLYELTGALRNRNDYPLEWPVTPGQRGPGAPIAIESGREAREVLVIDPATGDPLRRVRLPADAVPGTTFSTVVDGKPIVGTLLANPVRIALF